MQVSTRSQNITALATLDATDNIEVMAHQMLERYQDLDLSCNNASIYICIKSRLINISQINLQLTC